MSSKLQLSHSRAARVASLSGGSLLVGLSGKDSFATLAVVREHFQRVVCFHMYHVKGLECVELPLRQMCQRFAAELIFLPHPDGYRMLKHAVCRVHHARLDYAPKAIKVTDIQRLAKKRTGIEWIAYGERLADSFARRLFWRKLDGVYEAGQRCAPVVEWLAADVAAYNKAMRLPAPCTFGQTTSGTGFALTAPTLTWLKQRHPADYRRVLRVFPGAAAELLVERTALAGT